MLDRDQLLEQLRTARHELRQINRELDDEIRTKSMKSIHEQTNDHKSCSESDSEKYTYHVIWSEIDKEYVGLCIEFPSLSCFSENYLSAHDGITNLVADVLKDMKRSKEVPPVPLSLQTLNANESECAQCKDLMNQLHSAQRELWRRDRELDDASLLASERLVERNQLLSERHDRRTEIQDRFGMGKDEGLIEFIERLTIERDEAIAKIKNEKETKNMENEYKGTLHSLKYEYSAQADREIFEAQFKAGQNIEAMYLTKQEFEKIKSYKKNHLFDLIYKLQTDGSYKMKVHLT